ncbi:hypothetical protein LDL77_06435 [Flagellimonas marinaquae]|uniref:hypothetical protein n=1 Tax=Flagellimonas aurea TaxID=2915619 RepID=UPI001CE1B6FB|nr:hypothetical protein LDL77_06435 [Allomuricauda aquimarina]
MALTSKKASELGKKSSRKGVPNKATTEIRESFQNLIEEKLPKLSSWLDKVAESNPEKALDIIAKYAEFVLPKLQRRYLSEFDREENQVRELTKEEIEARIVELVEKAGGTMNKN